MPNKVPTPVHDLIENSEESVYVSRASVWEMAIKMGLGKLHIDLPRFCERIQADGFSWMPIENSHLLTYATLPYFDDHKEPLSTACWWRNAQRATDFVDRQQQISSLRRDC